MKNKLPNLSYWIFVLTLTILRGNINAQVIRCHTDEMEQIRRAENPNLETHEQFEKWMSSQISSKEKSRIINGVYTIPVVFHVINNGEAIGTGSNVSQAAIQSQIDVLNEDFRRLLGSNGYNTNSVGADTQIEFCLAQRRPDGSAFTAGQPGVNRINRSTAGFSAPPYADTYVDATIKPYTYNNGVATATRGWDPNKYLNIWLCNLSGGILGYAQFPESPLGGIGCGTTSSATDGVVFMYNSIGKSAITKNPAPYNEGRTATHEIGHWLGLRHIWGDASGTCGLDDFCNDTPIAADANYGCPTGTNSCTTFPGNDMIENYMDYTDDKCMNTFTNDQKTRMRIVLENSPLRLNLINSDACTPPNPNDASIVNIIKPTGDNCIGSITPSVVLKNRGASNLTSATISYSIDNGAVTTFSFTGNVVPGGTVNVNLPSFSTFAGTHTIKSFSTLPNGVADPSAFNDTVSLQFIVSNGITAPYVQNFEANVFPPDLKWSVNNPNNDCFEWLGASATSISGVAINKAAQMPAFGNTSAGTENLITPIFILPCNASAANIQFDVAYRRRNATTSNYERLYVDISQDCGVTWTATPIYDKIGTALQVLTTVLSSEYIPVGASDWRTETIDLLPFVTTTSKNVKFRFRAVAANGNDIYIDNFKFNATSPAEISVLQTTNEILDEGAYTFSTIASGTSSNVTFTVKNTGSSNLTLTNPISLTGSAFSVNTSFGSTTIAAGATTTFIISFNPSSGGTFSETLSFVNNDCDEGTYNFLLKGTATGPVNVPVVANFTSSVVTVCAGQTVTYTSTSTGNPTSYSWSFPGGNPATSTMANPVVTYSTAGTYSATLIATNTLGSNTVTKTNLLIVNALPVVAAITGGNSVCVGSTLPLSSTTSGGVWTSGTIANATVSSVGLVTGVAAGTSTITYSKTVSGCTASQTANVTVNASPVVSAISGTTTICVGTPTTLASSTVGGSWSSATPSVATISNGGVVTSLTAGTSLISYSLTTAGCTTTKTANVTVNALPVVAAITGGTSVCVGSTLPLTSVTTGGTWTSGTNANATVSSVGLVTGVLAGSSVITYSKTVSGCTSTQTANVTVNVSPVVSTITGTTTVCAGTPTTLSSSTVGGTWSSASPSVATISNGGVVKSLIAGTSLVSYSLTTAGCTTTKTVNVTVNALPVVSAINGVNTICLNTNQTYVNPTVLSGNNTVGQWSSIDPTIITIDQSGKASGLLIGSTTINYLVSSNGCSSTQSKVVNVVAQPVVNPIVGVNSICLNTGSTLTNISPSGVWSSSLPLIATISSTGSIVGVGVGNVTFSYAVSQNGCTSTQTKTLTVNALPVVSLNGLPTICKNWGTYNLVEGLPLGGQYSGTGISGSVLSFTNSGIYNVGYTYTDNNGCTNSVQSDISISECAGLDEVAEVKFDIYPNPTKDELNIISSNESIQDLKIIDNAGRIVFESKPLSLHVQLEVGNFADGLYTIQISSASKMINSKFVVRK